MSTQLSSTGIVFPSAATQNVPGDMQLASSVTNSTATSISFGGIPSTARKIVFSFQCGRSLGPDTLSITAKQAVTTAIFGGYHQYYKIQASSPYVDQYTYSTTSGHNIAYSSTYQNANSGTLIIIPKQIGSGSTPWEYNFYFERFYVYSSTVQLHINQGELFTTTSSTIHEQLFLQSLTISSAYLTNTTAQLYYC